jgi:hypothetical protein
MAVSEESLGKALVSPVENSKEDISALVIGPFSNRISAMSLRIRALELFFATLRHDACDIKTQSSHNPM